MWIGGDVVGENVQGSACLLNVEYKTGRYHLGRPVYCKLLNVLANTDTHFQVNHGIKNLLNVWIEYGYWTRNDGAYYDLHHQRGIYSLYMDGSEIMLNMIDGHYLNGWTAYVMLNYTKSTDPVVTE